MSAARTLLRVRSTPQSAREQLVAMQEKAAAHASEKKADAPSSADKVRHAVRKTFITKHVVELFLKNMSENDQPSDQPEEQHSDTKR